MNKIQYIENYLNRGWGLTPVGAPKIGDKNSGKNPFLPSWNKYPIKDLGEAKEYWDNDKKNNVGVMTGKVSGIVVLDIDEPKLFDKFLEQFPECRNTYIVRRNNAEEWQCHYYFRIDGFIPPSHNVKTTGWGDLMSNGKQVVAPPSIHYTSGVYEVLNEVEPLPFKQEYYDVLLMNKKTPPAKKKVAKEKISQGQRNNELFKRIQTLRDQGGSREEAEAVALDFCQECEPPYNKPEALKTVASAYSYNMHNEPIKTLEKLNYKLKKTVNEDGETCHKIEALPYHLVTEKVLDLLKDKVVNVNGELTILPEEQSSLQIIRSHADLFAYLGNEYQDTPDWKKRSQFMSREELLSLVRKGVERFSSIEYVPHYPSLKGVYYLTPELPPPDDDVIEKLLGFFTPETSEDRSLILALLMTVFWGGAPGQRAPFAITSKDGRGVGKSTLAETASKIIGQTSIQASTKDKAQVLITRLLSSGASQKRVVMFDNETSKGNRISNGEIAALFTLEEISGHKLYSAEASRQNNLVWIMTMNSPDFDSDFASRCVSISLKRPTYSSSWKTQLDVFIEKNRLVIISTLLSYLEQKTPSFSSTSRWGSWEAEVLAKVPDIDFESVTSLVNARRKSNDSEQDEFELILDEIKGYLKERGHDLEKEKLFIKNAQMAEIVKEATDLKSGRGHLLKIAKNIVDKSVAEELSTHRHRDWGQGFLWNGSCSDPTNIIRVGEKRKNR